MYYDGYNSTVGFVDKGVSGSENTNYISSDLISTHRSLSSELCTVFYTHDTMTKVVRPNYLISEDFLIEFDIKSINSNTPKGFGVQSTDGAYSRYMGDKLTGVWQHIKLIRTGSSIQFFVDDVQVTPQEDTLTDKTVDVYFCFVLFYDETFQSDRELSIKNLIIKTIEGITYGHGDMIMLEYDESPSPVSPNNPLNPETPFGFYLYSIVGACFDGMDDEINQYFKDTSLTSDHMRTSFINRWGREYDLPRPVLDGVELTDREYRIYLYLKRCRLLTIEDLLVCFNKCMCNPDDDVTVSVSVDNDVYLYTVDHPNYTPDTDTSSSNIRKNSSDVTDDYIINEGSSDDVNIIHGLLGSSSGTVVSVNIPPYKEEEGSEEVPWSTNFLELLNDFVGLKKNIHIKNKEESTT